MSMPTFNSTNIVEIFQYVNLLTEGWFGNLLPVSFFIIMFISMQRWELSKSLLASSFGSLSFSLFLWLAGITSQGFVVLFGILTGVAALLNLI